MFSRLFGKSSDSYKEEYFRVLHYQHRNFDVKGLTTQGVYTLELEKVFVDLALAPQSRGARVSADPLRSVPKNLKEGRHDLWTFLTDKQMTGRNLAILGAPGSGKTTLLKYITLMLAKDNDKSKAPVQLDRTPVLLFLRDFGTKIANNPNFTLLDAIQERLGVWDAHIPSEWFEEIFARGDGLIMFDGLDEVADSEVRRHVVSWVEHQMQKYVDNRFVVTSRPFGYYDNPLKNATVLEVRPFTLTQVRKFVHNWYRANEIMSAQRDDPGVRMEAKSWADDLLDRLNQLPVLLDMAVNPLLLTMIATVHRYRSSLPGRRVELYSEICEVFLGKRQQAKGMQFDLTPAQKQRVLQQLAFYMMVKNQREISFEDAAQVIERPLRLVQGLQQGNEGNDSADFLTGIENNSGLLIERESGVYSFAHLTFQEYLAAAHAMDQTLEKELVKHVENSWWHETIRLYAAQSDATNVIKACLARRLPSVPALTLAMECLEEAREVRPEMRTIFQRLADSVDHHSSEVRQTAAEVFLMLRLRRFVRIDEAKYVDTSLITNGEYQLFLEHGRSRGRYYQPDHWSGYAFKDGEGRKPVVGVRPSDAEAFCAWLTDRDNTGWVFRLPNANELNLSRLRSDGHVLEMEEATYWYLNNGTYQTATLPTDKGNDVIAKQLQKRFSKDWDLHDPLRNKAQFMQKIGRHVLQRAQQRQFVVKNLDRNLDKELQAVPAILQDFNQVRDRGFEDIATDLDLAIEEALAVVNDPNLLAARQIDLETIISLTGGLRRDVKRASDLNLPNNMLEELVRTIQQVRSLVANRESMNFIGLDRALNRALMIVRELAAVIAREKVNTRHRLSAKLLEKLTAMVEKGTDAENQKSLILTLIDLYIDIALLEERLAGTIPAYEGIRVVRVKI